VFSEICVHQVFHFVDGSEESQQELFIEYNYNFKTELGGYFGYINMCPIYSPFSVPKYWVRPKFNPQSTASIDFEPWVLNCLKNHRCTKGKLGHFIPPRLLEYDDHFLRLLNFHSFSSKKENNLKLEYAALSYCWGPTPSHLTLTTDNMPTLEAGISLSSLPQTFLDAIQICRQLKIKYIWIDSLCIVQAGDQQLDWLEHVSRMDMIYGSCLLQIAAAHSKDANGGCFSNRSFRNTYPAVVPPLNLQIGTGTSLPESLIAISKCARFCLPDDQKFIRTHLLSRGWVFQERLLAPRTLYYDSDDVYMECHEELICASIPQHFRSFYYRSLETNDENELPILKRPPYSWHRFDKRARFRDQLQHWADLTESYSKCQLTRIEDKLIAFSSIAKRVCTYSNDVYVAGFRSKLLPAALLWTREQFTEGTITTKPGLYIAPTWSWAHIDGSICYPEIHHFFRSKWKTEATVISTDIALLDENEQFGLMKSASITLSGPILKLHVSIKEAAEIYLKGSIVELELNEISDEIVSDFSMNNFKKPLPWGVCCWTLDERKTTMRLVNFDKWIWLVIQTARNLDKEECQHACRGIILEPTNEPGKFVRVGYFWFYVVNYGMEYRRRPMLEDVEVKQVTII